MSNWSNEFDPTVLPKILIHPFNQGRRRKGCGYTGISFCTTSYKPVLEWHQFKFLTFTPLIFNDFPIY